jgi:hypothetical protein
MQQQIPTIKITKKGENHYINDNQNIVDTEVIEEQERQEECSHDKDRYYQHGNWKIAKKQQKNAN